MTRKFCIAVSRSAAVLLALAAFASSLSAQPVRSGFSVAGTQARSDDTFTGPIAIGFPINFFGTTYSNLFVGTNGYVTFDFGQTGYDPQNLINYQQKIIAPFYADIDTRNTSSGQITWGSGTVNGRPAFAVTWNNVGYYNTRADKTNTFQLVIINRSDRATNDFDFEYNYNQIQWEAGNVNGGSNGLCSTGCEPPTAGYSNGLSGASNKSFEQAGSHVASAFLDTNTSTGLKYQQSGGSGVNGRLLFTVSNGAVSGGGGGGGGGGGAGFCTMTGGTPSGGVSLADGPICTETAITNNTCVVNRPTAVGSFGSTDPIATVWFGLSGLGPQSSVLARFSFNGALQTALDVGPYPAGTFQSGFNYFLCPSITPNASRVGNWTVSIFLNGSTTSFMTVAFTITPGSGGGVTSPTNSTIFGTSCAPSFPGNWLTNNVGNMTINPIRSDGFLTGGANGVIGDGFVIGRVLTALTNGSGAPNLRWLMAPNGASMVGLPDVFFGPGSASRTSPAAVVCPGTNTAALWIGQWDTTAFGFVRARLNLNGTVTFTLPSNCSFPGGTFTGTASGLTLSGTYSGPGGAGTFSITLGSNDVGVFSGTYTVGSSGPVTWSGKIKSVGFDADFISSTGFTGRWFTPYGLLTLKVTGTNVAGTYPGGTITGTVTTGNLGAPEFGGGVVLTGTYADTSGTGTISLRINANSAPQSINDPYPQSLGVNFYGTSTETGTGFTAPWVGARTGDYSGTWSTQFGPMTISQRGDGKWVGKAGSYTFVGDTTFPPAGGNAWVGRYTGPFGSNAFLFLLDNGGLSFSGVVDGSSPLGYYGDLKATYVSDTIGPLDLCATISPVITITTVPAGLQVNLDGGTATAPATRNWTPADGHVIGVTELQTLNGVQYTYSTWNDLRNSTHTILSPPASATYTAVFRSGTGGAGPGGFGGTWNTPNGPITMIPGPGNTINGLYPGGGFTCTVSGNTCTGTVTTATGGTGGTITITTNGPTLTGTINPPGGGSIPVNGTLPTSGSNTTGVTVSADPVMTTINQSACTSSLPSPLKYSFFTTDANITHWVSLSGVTLGDTIRVTYSGPGGATYSGTAIANWTGIWVCYTLPVSPATAPQGNWTVNLSVNGQQVQGTQRQFTVSSSPTGGSGGGGGGGGGGTGGTTPNTGATPGSTGTGGGGGGGGTGSTTLTVLATANIFASGRTTVPAFEGGGGTLPPSYTIPAGSAGQAVTVTNVTGSYRGCGSCDSSVPDGSVNFGGTNLDPTTSATQQQTFQVGISGIRHDGTNGFLVGVFTNGQVGAPPPPARLDFTSTAGNSSFSPLLFQTFFVGDGLTGKGTGSVQQFIIPAGATQLYLGFADGFGFTGYPGYYGDNSGQMTATLQIGAAGGGGTGGGTEAYWKFDEGTGTVASDFTGNGNFGTLVNGTTWTTGIKGSSVSFDGVDDYIDVGTRLRITSADFTIEGWIKGDPSMGAFGRIVDSGYLAGFAFGSYDGAKVLFEYRGSPFLISTATVIDNTWHYVAVVKSGGTATMYADGVLQGSVAVNAAAPTNVFPTFIGYNPGEGTRRYWKGQIDELHIYSRALTATEILTSYNGNKPGTGGGGSGGGAGNPPTTSQAGCSYNVQYADGAGGAAGNPNLRNVSATGVALSFGTVFTQPNCQFAAYSPVTWVKVTPTVMTAPGPGGQASWTYQIDAQPAGGAARQTILTVAGQQVTVTQPASTATSCDFSLSSSTSPTFPFAGTTSSNLGTVNLTVTGVTCTAQVAVDPAVPAAQQWVQITSSPTLSGPGVKTIFFAVGLNNTTSARSIRLIVTGRSPLATLTYTINQAAGPANTPLPPTINPGVGGITNSASFIPGGPIALGSFFSIFGNNMGPANPGVKADSYPLQPTLGGVSVAVTGGGRTVAALPVFVAQFQVNAIMPSNAPTGPVQIVVTYNGVAGPPQNANVVASAFGAFAVAAGRGPGIVQNAMGNGTRPLNSADTTASRNASDDAHYVILWGTGLGPLSLSLGCSGATAPDQCSPDTTFRPQVSSIQVFVGGVPANMQDQFAYAARAPGISGVDQVQFPLPPNAPLGCYVPLQVVVNGNLYSNTVTMAINTSGQPCADDNPISRFPRDGGKNGNVVLTRLTLSDPTNASLNGAADVGIAQFLQQPPGGPLGFDVNSSPLPLGTCTSYNNVDFTGLLSGQLPPTPGAQPLDAGATLSIRGPAGTQTMGYQEGGSTSPYQGLLGGTGAVALLIPKPAFLEPGAYTISGNGGRDVGAFSVNLNLGAPATLTTQVTSIDRAQPLVLNWTGGNPATQAILIQGSSKNPDANTSGAFFCLAPIGAGTFTVPTGMLANMPSTVTPSGSATGSFMFMTVPLGSQVSTFTSSAPALDRGAASYAIGSMVSNVTFR